MSSTEILNTFDASISPGISVSLPDQLVRIAANSTAINTVSNTVFAIFIISRV